MMMMVGWSYVHTSLEQFETRMLLGLTSLPLEQSKLGMLVFGNEA